MLKSVLNQYLLSDDIVRRLGNVLAIANEQGDVGVVDFVNRAVHYTVNGNLRTRDLETLNQLERTYNRDFYRGIVHVERVGDNYILA